jgi:hypothetical protein
VGHGKRTPRCHVSVHAAGEPRQCVVRLRPVSRPKIGRPVREFRSGSNSTEWDVGAMSGLLPLATELRTSMVVRLVPQLHRASCIDMSDYQDFLGSNLRVPSRNLRLNWMRSTKRQFSGCPMTHCLIPRLNIKLMRNAVISSAAIHIVSPAQFDRATAQTQGSERRAASRRRSVSRPRSGAACSRSNQGPEQAFIITGNRRRSRTFFRHLRDSLGRRGESVARAKAGDFIHVPAFLPHMEINPSNQEPFRWVVVRSTATPIVINLPDNTWS